MLIILLGLYFKMLFLGDFSWFFWWFFWIKLAFGEVDRLGAHGRHCRKERKVLPESLAGAGAAPRPQRWLGAVTVPQRDRKAPFGSVLHKTLISRAMSGDKPADSSGSGACPGPQGHRAPAVRALQCAVPAGRWRRSSAQGRGGRCPCRAHPGGNGGNRPRAPPAGLTGLWLPSRVSYFAW